MQLDYTIDSLEERKELVENQKLVAMVEMFGRESEVELGFNQVRIAQN